MKRKEYRKLVSVEEARKIISSLQLKPGREIVSLENSRGKTLAEDIFSEISVPSFTRAVMDGYAVQASDTYACNENEPVRLKLLGRVPAGSEAKYSVKAGEAVEISTGAPIPEGADAVVMVEYSSEDGEGVLINRPATINENIMKAGSDIRKGERVLRKGRKLGTREIGVLASVGIKEVPVLELPVGIISTGNELVRPGEKLAFGQIFDANSYTLYAGVQECGASPRLYSIVEDNEVSMRKALKNAVSECALVLTSGSTSSGAGDIMYGLIDEMGKTLAHGISIKPGKPVVVGLVCGTPVIGLPGNPTSALVIFNEFVSPLLKNSLGTENAPKKTEKGVFGTNFRSEGRKQLLPVGLARGKVYPVDRGSGAITSLAGADGFIEIPSETEFIEVGTPVEVTLFGDVEKPDFLITGDPCPGIDLLEDLSGLRFRFLDRGSSGGFSAISTGSADIAGVNLLSSNGEYNLPIIRSMGLSGIILLKGYLRDLGLLTLPNCQISGLEDLPGKHFINRDLGSGARAFLELKLEELAQKRGISKKTFTDSIPGYDSRAKSELAVCESILSGKAETGIGTRTCAEKNGLKFIKIGDEEYDFLFQKELLGTPELEKFLQALVSKTFAVSLPAGLKTYERTGERIEIK